MGCMMDREDKVQLVKDICRGARSHAASIGKYGKRYPDTPSRKRAKITLPQLKCLQEDQEIEQ